MTELLNMGGYGGYIWPAWGIALIVLGALIVASVKSMQTRERELAALEKESPRRRQRTSANGDAG